MFTLDINKQRRKYFYISVFCFIFSLIYEIFSHEVYSFYMIFAGFVPLIFGVGVFTLLKGNTVSKWSFNLYNSFIACLTVGMYMLGVFEIIGITNSMINYYFYASIIFLILTIIFIIIKKI